MIDPQTCQHEWVAQPHPDTRYPTLHACSICPTTVPGCTECGRPLDTTALAACERCIERGRRLVLDVIDDMARFPYTVLEVIGLRAIRYDVSAVRSSDDDVRLPFGMDRYTDDHEYLHGGDQAGARRPETALDVLHSWAADWAQARGDELPHDALGYLVDHTLWAIQNRDRSAWPTYVEEARAVRSTVRRILGINPVPESVPCPSCGGRLVREWQPRLDIAATPARESSPVRRRPGTSAEGLDDVVRCTRCKHSWPTPQHAHKAALAALEVAAAARPEAIVTLGQATKLYAKRVLPAAIRKWVHRGVLVPVIEDRMLHGPWRPGDDVGVRRFVLADVEKLVARCEQLAAAKEVAGARRVVGEEVTSM